MSTQNTHPAPISARQELAAQLASLGAWEYAPSKPVSDARKGDTVYSQAGKDLVQALPPHMVESQGTLDLGGREEETLDDPRVAEFKDIVQRLSSTSRRSIASVSASALQLVSCGLSKGACSVLKGYLTNESTLGEIRLALLYSIDATLNSIRQQLVQGQLAMDLGKDAQVSIGALLPYVVAALKHDRVLLEKLRKVLELWRRNNLLTADVIDVHRTQVQTLLEKCANSPHMKGQIDKFARRQQYELQRLKRTFGSQHYRPSLSARGYLMDRKVQQRFRDAGISVPENYHVKSEEQWAGEFIDPSNGKLYIPLQHQVSTWQQNPLMDESPDKLEGMIESLMDEVRKRKMKKQKFLQQLYERAEAEDIYAAMQSTTPALPPGLGPSSHPHDTPSEPEPTQGGWMQTPDFISPPEPMEGAPQEPPMPPSQEQPPEPVPSASQGGWKRVAFTLKLDGQPGKEWQPQSKRVKLPPLPTAQHDPPPPNTPPPISPSQQPPLPPNIPLPSLEQQQFMPPPPPTPLSPPPLPGNIHSPHLASSLVPPEPTTQYDPLSTSYGQPQQMKEYASVGQWQTERPNRFLVGSTGGPGQQQRYPMGSVDNQQVGEYNNIHCSGLECGDKDMETQAMNSDGQYAGNYQHQAIVDGLQSTGHVVQQSQWGQSEENMFVNEIDTKGYEPQYSSGRSEQYRFQMPMLGQQSRDQAQLMEGHVAGVGSSGKQIYGHNQASQNLQPYPGPWSHEPKNQQGQAQASGGSSFQIQQGTEEAALKGQEQNNQTPVQDSGMVGMGSLMSSTIATPMQPTIVQQKPQQTAHQQIDGVFGTMQQAGPIVQQQVGSGQAGAQQQHGTDPSAQIGKEGGTHIHTQPNQSMVTSLPSQGAAQAAPTTSLPLQVAIQPLQAQQSAVAIQQIYQDTIIQPSLQVSHTFPSVHILQNPGTNNQYQNTDNSVWGNVTFQTPPAANGMGSQGVQAGHIVQPAIIPAAPQMVALQHKLGGVQDGEVAGKGAIIQPVGQPIGLGAFQQQPGTFWAQGVGQVSPRPPNLQGMTMTQAAQAWKQQGMGRGLYRRQQ